jgi:hypothetical protein
MTHKPASLPAHKCLFPPCSSVVRPSEPGAPAICKRHAEMYLMAHWAFSHMTVDGQPVMVLLEKVACSQPQPTPGKLIVPGGS